MMHRRWRIKTHKWQIAVSVVSQVYDIIWPDAVAPSVLSCAGCVRTQCCTGTMIADVQLERLLFETAPTFKDL